MFTRPRSSPVAGWTEKEAIMLRRRLCKLVALCAAAILAAGSGGARLCAAATRVHPATLSRPKVTMSATWPSRLRAAGWRS